MTALTNQAMYLRIKEDILNQIDRKLLLPGDRLPTEQQLMEQYHVSRITITKAMNELKNLGVIERFPNRGTFVSKATFSSAMVYEADVPPSDTVPDSHIPEVACILPSTPDMFSLSIINGVMSAFDDGSYLCHIFQSRTPQFENYLLKRCLELRFSGIILFPQDQPFFSKELLTMQLNHYPLVLIDRYLPRLDTSYVISDNQSAGELCLKHLTGLGHQKIAFITSSGRDTFTVKRRLEGMFKCAAAMNMGEENIRILDHINYLDKTQHYDQLLLKLISEERITAFVASESDLCSCLYRTFESFNLHPPGDVSLMTFDKPYLTNLPPDYFTYIDQSEELIGHEAGMILRRTIETHDPNFYHRVITPTLKIHQSTGRAI